MKYNHRGCFCLGPKGPLRGDFQGPRGHRGQENRRWFSCWGLQGPPQDGLKGFREGPRGKLAKRETCCAWFSRYVRLVRYHVGSIPRLQSDCVTVLIWPRFPFSSDSCALKVSSWKDGTHTRKLDFVWSFCGYFLEALRHSSTTEGVTGCKLLLKFITIGDDDKELTELTLGVRHMEQAQRNSPQALRSMAPV